MAPGLVFLVLFLSMASHSSATSWCICKDGVSDSALQKTLDYACGSGADCTNIHQNGACFNPNTLKGHCNYAVNSYYQKKGQAQGSCDFAGTATVTPSDPSTAGCVYPTGAGNAGTTTPVSNTPTTPTTGTTPTMGTTPITGTTPTGGNSPYVTTPSNGIIGGGVGSGMGPSGVGINTDMSHGVATLQGGISFFLFSGAVLLWL